MTASGEITNVITSLYAALGNRPAFDAHLHPQIAIWESDAPNMLRGTGDLDALRDARAAAAAGGPSPVSVAPEDLLVEAWGDTGVARYVLRATFPANTRPDECYRVTDVLRRDDTGWRIVHHHSEARS